MEAVAAIASVAGILSLAGQALHGVVILRRFFQDCASQSHSIERFLRRLNDLIQILEHAGDLMRKLATTQSKIVPKSILASLQIQLDDCNKDVYSWLNVSKRQLPSSSTGTKAAFKKFLLALERERITDIYGEISDHKENIVTKLSMIGRCFDIDHSVTLETLCKRLKARDEIGRSTEPWIEDDQETVFSSYDMTLQPASSSSLTSIAESLSRIEDKMGDIAGVNRSQYGSRPGSQTRSIGSFDSSSRAGDWGRGWSSEPSQCSAFTAPSSMSASLSDRIAQSLLGVPRETPSIGSQQFQAHHCAMPMAPNTQQTNQHRPHDKCLENHFKNSLQMSKEGFISEAAKYLDLILLAETIIFKIRLFKTIPSLLFGDSADSMQSEITALEAQLSTLNSEAKDVQLALWKNGHNTLDLDSYMARCRDKSSGHTVPPLAKKQKSPDSELAKSELYRNTTSVMKLDATRHDRINMWLLNNLEASSKEMDLHRSFLPDAPVLDDEQWARMVLKYWLVDEAATGFEDICYSSNGAVDSGGMCHSERVLIDDRASAVDIIQGGRISNCIRALIAIEKTPV